MSYSLPIVLDNRIRIPMAKVLDLPPACRQDLRRAFTHDNPQRVILRRMGVGWNEPETYETWREDGSPAHLHFPRGGLRRVREVLHRHGVDWEVDDRRTRGEGPSGALPPYLGPKRARGDAAMAHRWRHLEELAGNAERGQNCIVRTPTGGGKTSGLLKLAAKINLPTLVVVPTSGLFKQWRERAVEELDMDEDDVGYVAQSRCDLAPLTIALQPSLARKMEDPGARRDLTSYFGCVLGDEVQYFAATTFFAVIDPFPAKYRIGTSADHRRKDKKEFLVHDQFGDVVFEISYDELVARGVIVPVEVRVLPTKFDAPWYGMRDADDPDDRREVDFTRLCTEMGEDHDRNELAVDAARQEVKAGAQVIVLTHQREHCLRLADMMRLEGLSPGFLIGGDDYSDEYDRTKAGLKDGSVRCAVGTYKATGTGIDLPRVDAVVAATPIGANEQLFNQVRGRPCRSADGKTEGRLWYLWDEEVFPTHLANVNRWSGERARVMRDGEWRGAREKRKRKRT